MREAPRELGEGFAVYSAELKRAAIRLHVYGTYRPAAAFREWPQSGDQEIASRFETIIQTCKSNTLTGWSVQQKRHDRALTCSGIPTDRAPNVSSPFPLRFQMQDRRFAGLKGKSFSILDQNRQIAAAILGQGEIGGIAQRRADKARPGSLGERYDQGDAHGAVADLVAARRRSRRCHSWQWLRFDDRRQSQCAAGRLSCTPPRRRQYPQWTEGNGDCRNFPFGPQQPQCWQ